MAYSLLDLTLELPKGLVVASINLGHEDRVVAETSLSLDLGGQDALHDAVENGLGDAILGNRQDTPEAGRALLMGDSRHLLQNKRGVGLVNGSQ